MIKKCAYCTNSFEAIRQDARYCSDSCKTRAYNDRKEGKPIIGNAPPPTSVADYYDVQKATLDDAMQSAIQHSTPKTVTHNHHHEHTAQRTDLGNHAAKQAITAGVATLKDIFITQSRGLGDTFFQPNPVPFFTIWGTLLGGAVGYGVTSKSDDILKVMATVGGGLCWLLAGQKHSRKL